MHAGQLALHLSSIFEINLEILKSKAYTRSLHKDEAKSLLALLRDDAQRRSVWGTPAVDKVSIAPADIFLYTI